MDDDIVFLGTSTPKLKLPSARPAGRPVTSISLHVERNGPVPAHELIFRRSATMVVQVGRRSASDPIRDDSDVGGEHTAASFRCAVVSRRHAKIAFSDSGHVYLIDLGSHHGTHVRSHADRAARTLVPETPTLLVDGDIITFGKSVGKGVETVKPIVARVALTYSHSTNFSDTSRIPNSRPCTPAGVHVFSSPISPVRSSSGRYGVPVGISPFSSSASSSSSDAEGDSVGHDSFSDIEEIPPPPHPQSQTAIPQILRRGANKLKFLSMPPPADVWHSTCQFPSPQAADESGNSAVYGEQPSAQSGPSAELLERQQRLRDALGRRKAQQQGQEPVVSPAPSVPPVEDGAPCTPSAPINQEVSTSSLIAPVSLVANRLPSMTSFIERPLSHFGLTQLSQFLLGGVGADKKNPAETETDSVALPSNSAEVRDGINDGPGPADCRTNADGIRTSTSDGCPPTNPIDDKHRSSASLPSLANALSPGHGNCHLQPHERICTRTWYPLQPAPVSTSSCLFHQMPAPLPPVQLPSSWDDGWWAPCSITTSNIDVVAPQQEDQRRSVGTRGLCALRQDPPPYNEMGSLRPEGATGAENSRGAAQSPPPAQLPEPQSPGLSYASSREPSPESRDVEEAQGESRRDREQSEPMELASRSPSAEPVSVDLKGKGRAFAFSFGLSDDENDDADGERDMDVEAESMVNTADLAPNNNSTLQLLAFNHNAAAAREAEIEREQDRERERERERQKEWEAAARRREADRREMEREGRQEVEFRDVQAAVKKLQADVGFLRGDTNTKIASHTNQLAAFDGRISEVDAECGVLCVRLDSLAERLEIAQIDVASVNAALETVMDGGENRMELQSADEDAVQASVSDAKALIEEMKALRATQQLQAEHELQALRLLRAEAETAFAALNKRMQEAQVQTQPPVLPSLKRKRDDIDEDEAAPDGDQGSTENVNAHESENADVVMDAPSPPLATSASAALHTLQDVRDMRPPPRKRARKIARFVARTATAVGVGAVVTWTALAFS